MNYKLYPSSSAFMKGASADTLYESACPRYILVEKTTADLPRKRLPDVYKTVGALDELRFFEVLKKRYKEVQREVPFKIEIAPNISLSGRIDFIADGVVYEKKSSINTSKVRDLKAGKVNPNQLAQLVT